MSTPTLGLRANWKQFTLLVIVNAFVGGMVGIERTVLPVLAELEFGIASHAAALSFIMAFGVSKALANYFTGRLAGRYGRKALLITGWVLALPVPFLLIYADAWAWVVAANILLGIHQGFAWSSTVVMKMDLVGEKDRGLAMGLNEFAGYIAVGLMAFLTGYLAAHYGPRPVPFQLGIAIAVTGLLLTLLWVKDTVHHVAMEGVTSAITKLKHLFVETSLTHRTLGSITQAGLVNNLNDGMLWGLLPVLLLNEGLGPERIGFIAAVYPAVWGIGQLFTGKLADHVNRRSLLIIGMVLQGLAILSLPFVRQEGAYIALSAALGLGTALVYPTFLAVLAAHTHPQQRSEAVGVFRLWRDLGYAIGALLTGLIADRFGITASILAIGVVTVLSGIVVWLRMPSERKCLEPADLKPLLNKPGVRVVDVRSPEEYASGHLPQAINIPLPELLERARSWSPRERIITVCAKGGGRSAQAAQVLRDMGFGRTWWLCGGAVGWR
ncbi:MAG TPA: MFS transporter [Flavobacteriales bacterium]|nr:MFS transporter [Flavobacteriales bacterium]HNU56618.1 MFS transporter [Flavobacteriales bacterium]